MLDGRCSIFSYSCGFFYGWHHTITKHKVYKALYLYVDSSTFKLMSPAETTCLFTCHFLQRDSLSSSHKFFYLHLGVCRLYQKLYIYTFYLNFLFKRCIRCFQIYTQILRSFEGQQLVCEYIYPSTLAILSYQMQNIISR